MLPRGVIGAVVAGMVGGVLPPLAAAAAHALETYPRPASGTFTVTGHGFGHGHGMSQYGARGAATRGLSSRQILDFYYPGTTAAALPAGTTIRVHLLNAPGGALTVFGAPGLSVRDRGTGAAAAATDPNARYRVVAAAQALHPQYSTDGGASWHALALAGRTALAGPVDLAGPATVRLVYSGSTSRDYEGTLTAVRTGATTLATVNTVPMDRYVAGVVPREMPSSWPAAALQTQAVAARTYAASQRAGTPAGRAWDTCDTTSCQVYGGRRLHEGGTVTDLQPASSSAAVAATANQIRSWHGQPIFAQFSASNGGWMSGDPDHPYLVSKADPYDPIGNPTATWSTTFTAAAVRACWPVVGTLDSVTVQARDGAGEWGGRVLQVRLVGHDAAGHTTAVNITGSGLRVCAFRSGYASNYYTITSSLQLAATPAGVGRAVDGVVDLFARSGTGLYTRRYVPAAGWQGWRWLAGSVAGAPAAERLATGGARAWMQAAGGALVSADLAANGGYLGLRTWGGLISSRPYPVLRPDGSELVFAAGRDGALWYGSWTAAGRFAGWRSLGGRLAPGAGPGAAATGPAEVVVAAVGTDLAVHTRTLAGATWGPWVRRGGRAAGDLGATSPAPGVVELATRGLSGHLYTLRGTNGVYAGWQDAGGALAAGPFTAAAGGAVAVYGLAPGGGAVSFARPPAAGTWARLPA